MTRGGRSRATPRHQRPPDGRRPLGLGGGQVEGRQAVLELLRARRRRVLHVWLEEALRPAPILDRIADEAVEAGVPLRRVSRQRLTAQARTESPQGVLARAEPLPEADLDDLCRRPSARGGGRPPFLLALDGVTDPQNLGALLRSADGAGVTGIILPRHRAVHVTPAVAKAAAGAIEWVPMTIVAGIPSALSRARELGLWIFGLDPGGHQSLFDIPGRTRSAGPLTADAEEGVVVVLGGEGSGLSPLVRKRCDVLVTIPLAGALPSLNVAAAGAVALFEFGRRFVSDDLGDVFKATKFRTENQ